MLKVFVTTRHSEYKEGFPCLRASGADCGGGSEGLIIGYDIWNFTETGDIGRTLSTSSGGLNEHIPVVIVKDENDESISKDNGSLMCE